MAERATKPGTLNVSPADRKKLAPLIAHYRGKAHPFTACLLPETPIDAPRDYERHPEGVPLHDLREGDLVWSFAVERKVFELKRVRWVGPTRRNACVVRLRLDTGREIVATPDHRFLRRDGTWAELGDLQPGDSLMPLYRTFTPRVRLSPEEGSGWHDEHGQMLDVAFGEDRGGLHAHHVDGRYANTHPTNFELLTGGEHRRRHQDTIQERFERRGYLRTCCDCGENFTPRNAPHKRCDRCAEFLQHGGRLREPYSCDGCGTVFTRHAGPQRYCSPACRPSVQRVKAPMAVPTPCQNCGTYFTKRSGVQRHCSPECRVVYRRRLPDPVTAGVNHKVVEVTSIEGRRDVWDMEVEDNHSFVVHGVVLHNCYRDQIKHGLSPDHAARRCAVLKDLMMGSTSWRKGGRHKSLSASDLDRVATVNVKALLPSDPRVLREVQRGVAEEMRAVELAAPSKAGKVPKKVKVRNAKGTVFERTVMVNPDQLQRAVQDSAKRSLGMKGTKDPGKTNDHGKAGLRRLGKNVYVDGRGKTFKRVGKGEKSSFASLTAREDKLVKRAVRKAVRARGYGKAKSLSAAVELAGSKGKKGSPPKDFLGLKKEAKKAFGAEPKKGKEGGKSKKGGKAKEAKKDGWSVEKSIAAYEKEKREGKEKGKWDEEKHPRESKGSPKGGKFAKKEAAEAEKKTAKKTAPKDSPKTAPKAEDSAKAAPKTAPSAKAAPKAKGQDGPSTAKPGDTSDHAAAGLRRLGKNVYIDGKGKTFKRGKDAKFVPLTPKEAKLVKAAVRKAVKAKAAGKGKAPFSKKEAEGLRRAAKDFDREFGGAKKAKAKKPPG